MRELRRFSNPSSDASKVFLSVKSPKMTGAGVLGPKNASQAPHATALQTSLGVPALSVCFHACGTDGHRCRHFRHLRIRDGAERPFI
jgi:hypothetical protein